MGRRVWVPVVSGPLASFSAAADRLYQFDQLSRLGRVIEGRCWHRAPR